MTCWRPRMTRWNLKYLVPHKPAQERGKTAVIASFLHKSMSFKCYLGRKYGLGGWFPKNSLRANKPKSPTGDLLPMATNVLDILLRLILTLFALMWTTSAKVVIGKWNRLEVWKLKAFFLHVLMFMDIKGSTLWDACVFHLLRFEQHAFKGRPSVFLWGPIVCLKAKPTSSSVGKPCLKKSSKISTSKTWFAINARIHISTESFLSVIRTIEIETVK